jgi:subtilisin family serine protease
MVNSSPHSDRPASASPRRLRLASRRTSRRAWVPACVWGLALIVALPAGAVLREYRVQFAPSPSSTVDGYTLHIGEQSRSYPVEFDLGAPPASGGTIIYAVDLEDSVDLFVAVRAYDGSGTTSSFSNEITVSAVEAPPEPEPAPAPEPTPEPEPTPDPVEEPMIEEPTTGLHLDDESEAIRLEMLEDAVRLARSSRSLYLTPGLLEKVASDGSVRVVFDSVPGVKNKKTAFDQIAAVLSGASQDGNVADAEWDRLRVFPVLGRAAAQVGPEALRRLIQTGFIERIEADAIHRASLSASVPLVRANVVQQAGFDGQGQVVALLDTGVDKSHPMLAGHVVEEACFSQAGDCPNAASEMFGPGAGAPCTIAGCAHGTQVAGAAVGAGLGLTGVGSGAGLISIRVFSDVDGMPGAFASDILAGLQHVLALTAFYDIAAVNLSLGGDLHTSQAACDAAGGAQRGAIELLREAGVVTVAAAGNDRRTNALALPACLSNVVSVGSSNDHDEVSSFSNSASFLSLLAPGESIETAEPGGRTTLASGTSLATAHVSGTIALLRQRTPSARVGEIENALRITGRPVRDVRNGLTAPRLRVDGASEVLAAQAVGEEPATSPAALQTAGGSGGGGAGACGLIGVEPFLMLGLVRLLRRRREV